MQKFILLFRGINVGGNNLLPMKELVPLLEKNNFQEVSTYIQSGNVVLTSATNPAEIIKSIVLSHFGFSPDLFVLDEKTFSTCLANNPYTEFEGKLVHSYFCHNSIVLNQEKLHKYLAESETFLVKGRIFYLHAANGIGRSKLVANIEACLGQPATGRNLNTVNKISLMLKST
jgi:uncharacterized protein (DUF1697 family)